MKRLFSKLFQRWNFDCCPHPLDDEEWWCRDCLAYVGSDHRKLGHEVIEPIIPRGRNEATD